MSASRGGTAVLLASSVILTLLLLHTSHAQSVLQRDVARLAQAKRSVETQLALEQAHGRELTGHLAVAGEALTQLTRRLESEAGVVERLTWHAADLNGQIVTLQKELALAVRRQQRMFAAQPMTSPHLVELEKVVVGAGAPPVRGRVVDVNTEWRFVVVDLGWDVLHIGEILGVYRDGLLIAKIGVERVQERLAAASLLPAYREAAIAVNDQVLSLRSGTSS